MAYRRKSIIVNGTDPSTGLPRDRSVPQKTRPIGITLPFDSPYGIFTQSFTNKEQVLSNLKNLLLTSKGERFLEVDFGTDLRGILFENITDEDDFVSRLKNEVESAIRRWLPYLVITELTVKINLTDDGRVDDPSHAVGIFLRVLISGTNIYLPVRIFISETGNIRLVEGAQN